MEKVKLPPIEIFTDGSCLSKEGQGSGPGGLGYLTKVWEIQDNVPVIRTVEGSAGYKLTTSNRMEILAALTAITEVYDGSKTGIYHNVYQINLSTDSKYLADAISKNWIKKWESNNWITSTNTGVKNKDLWERFIELLDKLNTSGIVLYISHVYGHTGNPDNETVDKLAVAAAKNSDEHMSDTAYEKSRGR